MLDKAICAGEDLLYVNPGHWRRHNQTDNIVECKEATENCVGDINRSNIAGNFLCYEGHIGALCMECDIEAIFWSESFAHSSSYACGRCS